MQLHRSKEKISSFCYMESLLRISIFIQTQLKKPDMNNAAIFFSLCITKESVLHLGGVDGVGLVLELHRGLDALDHGRIRAG